MNHTPEIAAATLVVASITSWMTDKDWERAIGPWGGLFVSLGMLGILLLHSRSRIKRDDQRAEKDAQERERRHTESLAAMKETHGKFETLTSRQMDTQLETAKALLKLSHSCEILHSEMRSRPCQVNRFGCHSEPSE